MAQTTREGPRFDPESHFGRLDLDGSVGALTSTFRVERHWIVSFNSRGWTLKVEGATLAIFPSHPGEPAAKVTAGGHPNLHQSSPPQATESDRICTQTTTVPIRVCTVG